MMYWEQLLLWLNLFCLCILTKTGAFSTENKYNYTIPYNSLLTRLVLKDVLQVAEQLSQEFEEP